MRAPSPRSSLVLNSFSLGLVVLLLVYLIQFEDSLLRIAARSVYSSLTLPAVGIGADNAGRWAHSLHVPPPPPVDAEWEHMGEAAADADAPAAAGAEPGGSAVGGASWLPVPSVGPDSEHLVPPPGACFSLLDALPRDTKRRTATDALLLACACAARAGPAGPSSFTLPLLWWASARITAFAGWANGPRSLLDEEFSWHYGFVLERPVESYPHVFWNRSLLAWQAGMLFTPTYWLSGRFQVRLSTAAACGIAGQALAPVANRAEAGVVWHERTGVLGVQPLDAGVAAAAASEAAADHGGAMTDDSAADEAGGERGGPGRDASGAAAAAAAPRSPFYEEALARALKSMRAGLHGAPGASLQELLSGGWVTLGALEAAMKSMSTDMAVGAHSGGRVHLHTPLSPVIVPRFYPDIFKEMGLTRLLDMGTTSTAIRDWAFVSGVVHNVTHYMVTYAGVFFRKTETAVLRLNRLKRGGVGAGGAAAADGAALLRASRLPSASPNPTPFTAEYDEWITERQITGVSVKACKIMPTPGASRPPSPSPVAQADFPQSLHVDEFLPITVRG